MRRPLGNTSLLLISFIIIIPMFMGSRANALPNPMRVGFYENPPKLFTNDQGEEDGFWPDLVKEIARLEGWNLEWVHGTFDELINRTINGTIDIMVDVGYTDARSHLYTFSNESVFLNWGMVYARQGSTINSLTDLQDKKVAVMTGSTHTTAITDLLDQFDINCTFVYTSGYSGVFDLLRENQAEAGVVNRLFGMQYEAEYNVRQTAIIFNPSDLKFALNNASADTPTLIERLDYHIKAFKADPNSIYYKSIQEHFLGGQGTLELPVWFVPTLVAVIAVAGVLMVTSFVLRQRKRVLEKTNFELNSTLMELGLLVEKIPDGVVVAEPDGKVRLANNAFKKIFENLVGERLTLQENILTISKRSEFLDRIQVIIQNYDPASPTVEVQKDQWIQVVPSFIRPNPSAPPILIVIETRDVTSFVEYDKLRKQFVSMVSHELRTPITAIHMSLENLARYRAKMTEDQQKDMITSMTESVKVLRTMIEDLLVLSRVDSQKVTLTLANVNLRKVVDTVVLQLDSNVKAKSMAVEIDIPTEITIFGDQTRLGQVIRVLLDNAVKYSPEKSKVVISAKGGITRQIKDITVRGTLIQVKDSGLGIPPNNINRLFDRFFRADNVREIQGTGLGLSIAKEFVTLHNGEIWVDSQLNKGSTFSVFLPDQPNPPAEPPTSEKPYHPTAPQSSDKPNPAGST